MKSPSFRLLRPCLALGLAVLAFGAAQAAEVTPLRDGWRFVRTDAPGAEAAAFDDSSWVSVSTPHTYNVADSGIGGAKARGEPEGVYYRGPAWYRLSLDHTPRAGQRTPTDAWRSSHRCRAAESRARRSSGRVARSCHPHRTTASPSARSRSSRTFSLA